MACWGDAISYSLDEIQLMDTCGENIFPVCLRRRRGRILVPSRNLISLIRC